MIDGGVTKAKRHKPGQSCKKIGTYCPFDMLALAFLIRQSHLG